MAAKLITAGATTPVGSFRGGEDGNDFKRSEGQDRGPSDDAIHKAGTERKIIRNAELYLEADSPEDAQRSVSALAESHGGFVVSSDVSHYGGPDNRDNITVTLVLRVPAPDFNGALDALHKIGKRVSQEKITGVDVTEEFVDLEARLSAQRAVEAQYLEILKDAHKVQDALDVQQKLGEVRTEIERIEGRKRYLENQASLSTLTIHISHAFDPTSANNFSFGFVDSIKQAGRDAIEVGATIITGAIRLVGVLIPVTLLIFMPIWLFIRAMVRRSRAKRASQQPVTPSASKAA